MVEDESNVLLVDWFYSMSTLLGSFSAEVIFFKYMYGFK